MKVFLAALVLLLATSATALAQTKPTRLPVVKKLTNAVTRPVTNHCDALIEAAVERSIAAHMPAPVVVETPVIVETPAPAAPAAETKPAKPDDYEQGATTAGIGLLLALCVYTRIH